MCLVKDCCGLVGLQMGCVIIVVLKVLQYISSFFAPFIHDEGWLKYPSNIAASVLIAVSIVYLWYGVFKERTWATIMFEVITLVEGICCLAAAAWTLSPESGTAWDLPFSELVWAICAIIVSFLDFYSVVVMCSYLTRDYA